MSSVSWGLPIQIKFRCLSTVDLSLYILVVHGYTNSETKTCKLDWKPTHGKPNSSGSAREI